ncbi:glycosyltransferase family 9 protein, partial [Gemmatimonadota bacterium]
IEKGCQVIITGTEVESGMTGAVAAVEGTVDLTGRTTLGQLAWILKTCDTMIANSTGVLHLGSSDDDLAPFFDEQLGQSHVMMSRHKVFRAPVDICGRRGCAWEECEDYNCLERVLPEAVLAVVEGFVTQSPLRSRRSESTLEKGKSG